MSWIIIFCVAYLGAFFGAGLARWAREKGAPEYQCGHCGLLFRVSIEFPQPTGCAWCGSELK